ncbi:hypothetical protein TNCV_4647511 [Trichonephila clavipes]|uniref:Uncharacterized protein n=1 Tax=Trichonephila clavipes TaxID=2585209 RepID=A0A8X6VN00_TRICX|nr:hypothetical protein TNCV_4647511 [Trichonephila clavipes]
MDWEDVPFLPEVSAPFVPSRAPRKMRSLISVQVSEPPSLSANRFPHMRALVPKITLCTEGGVSLHSRGCPEGLLKRAASRDQSSRPPSDVPRATLFIQINSPSWQPRFRICRKRRVGSQVLRFIQYRQYGCDNT